MATKASKAVKAAGSVAGKRTGIAGAVTLQQLLAAGRTVDGLLADVPASKRVKVTPMRRAVWAAVTAVPKGQVGTYSSIGYAARWLLAA
eukprot:CAMPEP_0174876322 /NCGR_PEP_ID=MMETSP1114-20130205/79961_1 /TAXON_ID=312471 /ORGANISM="Neobodo designis, Strain CCAP 1951/1" /LENGTH=88 /DNA_ID=CAMNT_0016111695 /DNA_START=29 /DNA_END=291 /DNA_ORIENTATION=+